MDYFTSFREFAEAYGVFFALFLAAVIYLIWFMANQIKKNDKKHENLMTESNKRNDERENRYIEVIEGLSENYGKLDNRLARIEIRLEARD